MPSYQVSPREGLSSFRDFVAPLTMTLWTFQATDLRTGETFLPFCNDSVIDRTVAESSVSHRCFMPEKRTAGMGMEIA